MSRAAVVVRDAVPDDLPVLLTMWHELRDLSGRLDRTLPMVSEDGVLDRLKLIADDPHSRALVGVIDGEVAGMAVLTTSPYAPLFDQDAVHVHYLHVRDGYRRRGVGNALLATAVAIADEVGRRAHRHERHAPAARDAAVLRPAGLRSGRHPAFGAGQHAASAARAARGAMSLADNVVARRRTLRRVRAAVARVTD